MTVIVMTEDVGSRGEDIAAGAAASLGLELVTMEELELLVAKRMRTRQERLHRLISGRASLLERWTIDGRRLPQYTDKELVKLAARDGILIESWRVASPLRAVPHVICVHACASAAPHAPVTSAPHFGVGRKALGFAPLIQGPGEVRQAYDLVLNTAAISVTEGVEQVTQIAQSPRHQPTVASQRIVAGLLQQAQDWRDELGDFGDPNAAHVLDVEIGCERLRLHGVTSSEEAIAQIEERLLGKSPAGRITEPEAPWRM
jgi:hypothetical protein